MKVIDLPDGTKMTQESVTDKTERARVWIVCRFETFESLEQFFIDNILGRTSIRSKVIGKTLIYGRM